MSDTLPSPEMRVFPRLQALLDAIERTLNAESQRLAPWLVVALGGGIAVYFSLKSEPPLWGAAPILALAAIGLWAAPRAWRLARDLAILSLVTALGFQLAALRTAMVGHVVLARTLGPVRVEGTVLDRDGTAEGAQRLTLAVSLVSGLVPEATPERAQIKVALPLAKDFPVPGDRIALTRAVLLPPPMPVAPGAFDFARRAYFMQIGAYGSVRAGEVVKLARTEASWPSSLAFGVWRFRHALAGRIAHAIEDPAAAGVAIALVTGLREAIPAEADEALRSAGLTHTLSISGLHLGLIAFGVFAALRLAIAVIEPLALRINGKKWAAAAALAAVTGYFLLTGISIPAQRSYVMLALVLLAVMSDRRAFTMRNVALAAGLILVLFPEGLLDAGFQMSFAAVVALVSAHEALERRRANAPRDQSAIGRFKAAFVTASVSSLAASAATVPFGLYHFQALQNYGVIGNLLALPVLGTLIMPAVAASYFLLPFGLSEFAFVVLGWGLEILLAIARAVAALPGAAHVLHAAPAGAFIAVVFGGLWLALWSQRWRWLGLAPIGAGVLAWWLSPLPDILISSDGRQIAARAQTGALEPVFGRSTSFAMAAWLRRGGEAEVETASADPPKPSRARCDSVGCTLTLPTGARLAVSRTPAGLPDDCARANIVVSQVPVRGRCRGPDIVIDRFDLWRNGAYAIWLTRDGARVLSVRDVRGVRPWAPEPQRRAKINSASTSRPNGPGP